MYRATPAAPRTVCKRKIIPVKVRRCPFGLSLLSIEMLCLWWEKMIAKEREEERKEEEGNRQRRSG